MSVKKELIIPGTECVVKYGKGHTKNPSFKFFVWPKNTSNMIAASELIAGSNFKITSTPFKRKGISGKFVNITISDENSIQELETFYICIRYDAEIV